ncbi:hypothetical protein T439DRAFT_220717 [Meredithblackwellia eburnea MCA 4105]
MSGSYHQTHARRRSSQAINLTVDTTSQTQTLLTSPSHSTYSDDTAVGEYSDDGIDGLDIVEESVRKAKKGKGKWVGEYESIMMEAPELPPKERYSDTVGETSEKLAPPSGWRDASSGYRDTKRKRGQVCCRFFRTVFLAATAVAIGYGAAQVTRTEKVLKPSEIRALAEKLPEEGERCNPYDQHGVLLVNTSVPYENKWSPISAPASCQPVDYASQIWMYQGGEMDLTKDLEHLRNKTVVIFGDSVDRDHNEHFCGFARGRLEMIGANHPWAPPYPKGEELPPVEYKDFLTGLRQWPSYDQSRPYICHVDTLNLRILNVFHYGFRGYTKWISTHPHYYPPAAIEDRFDQILVPLMKTISQTYGVPEVPDILSIAPGFWGLLRLSVETDATRDALIREGKLTTEQAYHDYDVWNNMKKDQRDWMESRIFTVLKHVANGWSDGEGRVKRPRILWRALHHIKEHHNIPFSRLHSLDQIGRSVVQRLVNEGRAAEKGEQSWKAWVRKASAKVGLKWKGEKESEALRLGLGHRLRVDEWGSLMIGQEKHFRDNVHPRPLPGSWLWANMAMNQLAMLDEDQAAVEADEY